MAAIREVGKDKIILDLTSGKKDITGSLYTAASICEISNMIYVEVNRKDDGSGFYDLSLEGANIQDKCKLRKFQSLDEIENLASLNCMEFIIYKKTINDIMSVQSDNQILELYCNNLTNAIDSYFQFKNDSVIQCIRSIGIINERLIGIISKALWKKFGNMSTIYKELMKKDLRNEGSLGLIEDLAGAYRKCSSLKKLNEEKREFYFRRSK